MLIGFPIAEALLAVWPLRPTSVPWRYGAAGLLSRALFTPIFGATLALVAAHHFRDRVAERTLAVAGTVVTVLLLLGTALFMNDTAALRRAAVELGENVEGGNVSVVIATVKLLTATIVMGISSAAAWSLLKSDAGTGKAPEAAA